MEIKNKNIKTWTVIIVCVLFNLLSYVYVVQAEESMLEPIEVLENVPKENRKVAYLTFDDGTSIYTEELLNVLNEYKVPGIFFVLGSQLKYVPNSDKILNRIVDEGHYIGLHSMTHDKQALYGSEKSPTTFTKEMLDLKDQVKGITGHVTNLCRAPYGKKGNFKPAHYKAVEEAGLDCVDWDVDSQDWAKKNAKQIYNEVIKGLEKVKNENEVVLLFHEHKRTVEAMPLVIEYLIEKGYTFEPYVEGKSFEKLK